MRDPWHELRLAAVYTLRQIDQQLDTEPTDLKYVAPWHGLTRLRIALRAITAKERREIAAAPEGGTDAAS